jgi:hypothetical protein
VSGHANVDFHYGVVQFLFTLLLDRPRQCTVSFDLRRGNSWQLAGGGGDARSIFGGKLLRQGTSGLKKQNHQATHEDLVMQRPLL